VIGESAAAMVDTGIGRGDLRAAISEYTELPITVICTHADGDHIGTNHLFDNIYMSNLDDPMVQNPFPHKDIKDGDSFDLGGIVLEAIALPGHSLGSFCFFDRANNELFTGDGVNKLPWLFLERCTVLSEYLDSLNRLRDITSSQPDIYCGHSLTAFPYQVLLDSIQACEEVIAGKRENDLPYFMPFGPDTPIMPDVFEHQVGEVHLIYNSRRL